MKSNNNSLQHQIRIKLFSAIGLYFLCTALIIVCLSIFSIVYFQKNELRQYEELVKTKIDSDISAILREASNIGTSPVVWTGLTDSTGRDAYLSPLLNRINSNSPHRIQLLDYRGREFIVTKEFERDVRDASSVIADVVKTDQVQTKFINQENDQYYLIALPIVAPFSDGSIGFLLIKFDVSASINSLKLPKNVDVIIDAVKQKIVQMSSIDSITDNLIIKGGDYVVELSVGVKKPIIDSFILLAIGVLIAGVGTLFVFINLKNWSYTFSQNTTKRLAELVKAASRVAQGKDFSLDINQGDDEIDDILFSIQDIFQRQKEINAKLLVSSQVFDTAGEAILVTNTLGKILEVNRALMEITGYSREELIGKSGGMLYRNNGEDATDQVISKSLAAYGVWRGETYFITKDKRHVPVMLTISTLIDDKNVAQGNVAVFSDVSQLKNAEDKLKKLLFQDQLTGLPNFRGFFKYISDLLECSKNRPFILLFIDLDNFKMINDTYNHEQGDIAICQVAEYLTKRLPKPHKLFRRSGDEFIAILEIENDIGATSTQLSNVLHSVTIKIGSLSTNIISSTFSAGAAIYPVNSNNIQDLLIYADSALQSSKENGKSKLTWFDDGVKEHVRRRNLIETSLASALNNGKIIPYYQPEVDLRTGKIIGVEALARWHDDNLGFISPSEFIPIAERVGAIDLVTTSIISKVLRDLGTILESHPDIKVSFNSSPKLFQGNKIFKILLDAQKDSETSYSNLIMEITESEMMQGGMEALTQLDCIIGLGVQIAIDDFGKEFSSLSRLSSMPIHKLKIDKSFINTHHNANKVKVIESIINLANSLSMDVTAEGVETLSQRDMLIELGCFKAQGYLYSKPLPLQELMKLPRIISPHEEVSLGD